MKQVNYLLFLLIGGLTFIGCNDGKVNFFSLNQDVEFGQQVVEEIMNSEEFTILPREGNEEAYAYLENIRDRILQSKDIRYADRFEWDVYIIDDDVLNAFALPGGPTFYYTGLMKFLDDEASLAGVMAHEIAHVDRRHSTNRMTKGYGFSILLSILLGDDPSLVAQVAADLAAGVTMLQYSQKDEYEADEYAVRYLIPTELDARGVAYFFEKIEVEEGNALMKFFSTHPHPHDRIEKIYEHYNKLNKGASGERFKEEYEEFKSLLP